MKPWVSRQRIGKIWHCDTEIWSDWSNSIFSCNSDRTWVNRSTSKCSNFVARQCTSGWINNVKLFESFLWQALKSSFTHRCWVFKLFTQIETCEIERTEIARWKDNSIRVSWAPNTFTFAIGWHWQLNGWEHSILSPFVYMLKIIAICSLTFNNRIKK